MNTMNNILLFITWNPDLTAFHIGPITFRWYSLCWLIGLALAYIVVKKLYQDQKIEDRKFDPLFFYCFIGILVGARLGHCIFYQPQDYLTSVRGFIEMLLPIQFTGYESWDFKVTGYEGLASHGGTLGLMLALWLYVRRFKMPLWQVLDNIAIATGITACFIRLGNLMNSEIIGSVTSMPWGFYFVNAHPASLGTEPRHPSQLYEAIAYLLLFFLMLYIYRKDRQSFQGNLKTQNSNLKSKLGTGFYFGLCLTYIFTFRFFVEFLKINQVGFEDGMPLDMGQLLSIPFVILGVWCMRRARTNRWTVLLVLFTLHFSLSVSPAGAQGLYDQNMKLGDMFYHCGSITQAENYYQKAINNTKDKEQWLTARLRMIDLMKFWRPNEAQQLINECFEDFKKRPELHQQALAMNASISFWVGNKEAFDRANSDYLKLSRVNSQLPTTYDIPLQAMKEAMEGYYTNALNIIDEHLRGTLIRHQLRLRIFEMNGNKDDIINELQQRAKTVDSLTAANYDENLAMANLTNSMTVAHQEAEQHHSNMLLLIIIMAVVMAIMLLSAYYMYRKNRNELLKKNEQMAAALNMANESDQMKTEFVKRVSHEIRTPLNAITGFNDILNNSDIELPQEERQDLIDRINENVTAIIKIVDELLLTADTESMQSFAREDEVLCNQFLSSLLNAHRDEVNANVELRYTTQVINRFTLKTNAETLRQIVEQLIDNAIKFTQRGFIEVNCRQEEKNVIITVTDTGSGIPAEQQDKVFEQFAKGNAFQQGIGLGLTVSRKMAQKMGGSLELDKTYAGGTRFILTLLN